jgi:LEA14-like dessication related protein
MGVFGQKLALLGLLAWVSATAACGATTKTPYMSVVGAHKSTGEVTSRLILIVEIHNPTGTPLWLRDLDYRLARIGGDDRHVGKLELKEVVPPGRTVTFDISVPVDATGSQNARYDLTGRLRGAAGDVQMSWDVDALAAVGEPTEIDAQ